MTGFIIKRAINRLPKNQQNHLILSVWEAAMGGGVVKDQEGMGSQTD